MKLKQFCDENLNETLTETEWAHVKNIITILEPFNKYSKKLQSEKVTLSDFFGYWTVLRIKMSKSDDQFSQQLLNQMNNYHDMLIENPTIIGAVYLDPRYQRGLGNKKSLAVDFLADLYEKITRIEAFNDASISVEIEENNNHSDGSYEELNEYLDACNSAYGMERTNYLDARQKITNILNDFNGEGLPLTASVLEYWKEKSNTKPELYKLASVMMTIPPTQTSVERVFSALALVLTSHRTRLGDETLENILLVRLNHDLFVKDNLNTEKEVEVDVIVDGDEEQSDRLN